MSRFPEDGYIHVVSRDDDSDIPIAINPSERTADSDTPLKVTKHQMKAEREKLFQLIRTEQDRIRKFKYLDEQTKARFVGQLEDLITAAKKDVKDRRTYSNRFFRTVWPAQLAEIEKHRVSAEQVISKVQSESLRMDKAQAKEMQKFETKYRGSMDTISRLEGAQTGAARDQGVRLGEKIMSELEMEEFLASEGGIAAHTVAPSTTSGPLPSIEEPTLFYRSDSVEEIGSGSGFVGLPLPVRNIYQRREGGSAAPQASESQAAHVPQFIVRSTNALGTQESPTRNMGVVHTHRRTDTAMTADTFGVVGGWRHGGPLRAESRMSDVSKLSSQEGSYSQHDSVDHLPESQPSDTLAQDLEGLSLDEAHEDV